MILKACLGGWSNVGGFWQEMLADEARLQLEHYARFLELPLLAVPVASVELRQGQASVDKSDAAVQSEEGGDSGKSGQKSLRKGLIELVQVVMDEVGLGT